MKKYIIFILCVLLTKTIDAQKTDKTKVDYEILKLPLNIISKEKKFDVMVEYDYAAKVEAANAEIAANKEAAKKDKEDYEKKSTGQKLAGKVLLGESKPSGTWNNSSFIPTLFPVDGVKGSVQVPGYQKLDGAKGTVSIMFFELSYEIDKTLTKITYYPLKIVLTVTNDKGEVVYQGDLPGNSTALTYTAATGTTLTNANTLSALRGCETAAKNEAVKNLNSYLKVNYGFNMVKDERAFFDVKDKKMKYPEYHEAFEKVKTAFLYVNLPDRREEMVKNLKEAIALWEGALKEYDKTNPEARINNDIAAATYLNIAEAYIWLNEFDKSMDALASYKLTGEDYNKTYKDKSEFLKDYSDRYNKFTNY